MSPAATANAVTLDVRRARRLSLAKAGLLRSDASTLPRRASGSGRRARQAALEVIDRFGYLQLDTVSVAGARSHALVLLSRLEGMDPALGESLLQPGEPLFEYWGHEASWLPIELYPVFAFRRVAFRRHPWWGDLLSEHRKTATEIVERIRSEGPLRSVDLEGKSGAGWWNLKLTKRLANALWSSGELAIRERRSLPALVRSPGACDSRRSPRSRGAAHRRLRDPAATRPRRLRLGHHQHADADLAAAQGEDRHRRRAASPGRAWRDRAVQAGGRGARGGGLDPALRSRARRAPRRDPATTRPRRAALAVRSAAVGSRPRAAPLRLRSHLRDLRARAETSVGLLLPAGARRRSSDRARRPQGAPPRRTPRRAFDPPRGRRRRRGARGDPQRARASRRRRSGSSWSLEPDRAPSPPRSRSFRGVLDQRRGAGLSSGDRLR